IRCGAHSGCPTLAPPRRHFSTHDSFPGLTWAVPQLSSLTHPVSDAAYAVVASHGTRSVRRTICRLIDNRQISDGALRALRTSGSPLNISFRRRESAPDPPPTGRKVQKRHEQSGPDDRPDDRKRVAAHAEHERLGQVELP